MPRLGVKCAAVMVVPPPMRVCRAYREGTGSATGVGSRGGGARTAKFAAFQGHRRQVPFHLKAANGEIIAASQGYTSKAAAQNGIASIKDNAASAPTEDLT